jgi:hypothetical protein
VKLPDGTYACDPMSGDGCDGGRGDGGSDAGPDAGPPRDAGFPADLCINTWCWDHPRPVGLVTLRTVFELSHEDVWVAGGFGNLLHFDGKQWQQIPTGVTTALNHVWAYDHWSVWVVGAAGSIFEWDGTELVHHDAGVGSDLRSVAGLNPNDVWITGNNGLVLHWDGQEWSKPVIIEPSGDLYTLDFWSPTRAFAMGEFGLELNGMNWSQVPQPPDAGRIYATWAPSPSEIWAVGDLGGLYRNLTSDLADGGGWDVLDSGTTDTVNAVWSLGPDHSFWGSFNGGLWENDNGSVTEPSTQRISAIHGRADNDVWAVGNGTLLHRSVAGAYFDNLMPSTDWNYNIESVAVLPSGLAYAVGDTHAVMVRDAGVWSRLPIENNINYGPLHHVWADGRGDIIVVGGDPMKIGYWDAGVGRIVAAPNVAPAGDVYGVWGSSGDDVWAVGQQSYFAHSDGGQWVETYLPQGLASDFNAVWGSGPDDVYIVGNNSRVLHWDGMMFNDESLPGTETLSCVTGLSAAEVYVGDYYSGAIYRRTGPGMWVAEMTPGNHIRGLATYKGEVYAAGDYGTVLHRQSTGDWVQMVVPIDPGQTYFYGIAGASGAGLLAGGTYGQLIFFK